MYRVMAVALALMLALLPALCCADAAPKVEYAALTAQVQELAAPEKWLEHIAPADVQFKATEEERLPGYVVTTLTGDGFRVEFDGYGMFRVDVDSDIPIAYRSEGEGAYLPPPSKVEGRYTQQEAEALAMSFLSEALGMDTSQLELRSAMPEDASKERSRAYRFEFGYQYEGVAITGVPPVSVAVNDDGVVQAGAQVALSFLPGAQVSADELLTEDELIARLGREWTPPLHMPVYSFVDFDDVRPAWMFTEYDEQGNIIWNGMEYDMLTGAELERESIW